MVSFKHCIDGVSMVSLDLSIITTSNISPTIITIPRIREGLTYFDHSSGPLQAELSKGKFTILPR